MGYLMGFLKGNALTAVKGLLVINENYDVALKMLEERFGDPQLLIHKHMTILLSFDTISSIFDLKNLRKVYDEVETQISSLENLGLDLKSYESLLAPDLMSKLSDELKRLTSRQFGKNFWEITAIMKLFRNLVRTLNKHLKKINVVKVNSCYAYFVDEIKSISCDIITKPDVRKNILKTEKRYFNCLKQGHLFSDCRSNLKCFKCDGN